jgi:hypothetical protein
MFMPSVRKVGYMGGMAHETGQRAVSPRSTARTRHGGVLVVTHV